MKLGLKGKVAVVTGGTSGIGRATAKSLAVEGCYVVVCSRNLKKCQEIEKEFSREGYEILALPVDVSKSDEVQEFIDKIIQQYGKINIWINNAGIYPKNSLIDMAEDEWDRVMAINLKSVFLGCKLSAKQMQKNGGGVIINAASFAALTPTIGNSAYGATKAAILNMTKTLAAEVAPFNIRVNAYIPGVIETPLTKEVIEKNKEKVLEKIALNRVGTPQEVSDAIIFLVSDAASYITGTSLEISGGKLCVQDPQCAWQQ